MIPSGALKKRLMALLTVCSEMSRRDHDDLCEVMREYQTQIARCPKQVDRPAYQALY